MTAPDPDDIAVLIALLARVDVLFAPLRGEFHLQRWGEIAWRRRQYRRLGLPGTGGAGQERLQAHRLYRRLARAGLVELRGSGRAFGVRLTDATDWWLRRRATWHDLPQALTLVGLVRWHELAGPTNCGFICEWSLVTSAPLSGDPTPAQGLMVAELEEIARPALVRCWLLTRSDHHGAVGYQTTPAGRAALSCKPALPAMPEYSSSENDLYLSALDEAAAELAAARPQAHHHDVPVCLSCGLWPPRDPTLPALFTTRGRLRSGKELAAFAGE